MQSSIQDILLLSLQFLYAFGGLILIGVLLFNIVKNQSLINEKKLLFEADFDHELANRLSEHPPPKSSYTPRTQKVGGTKHNDATKQVPQAKEKAAISVTPNKDISIGDSPVVTVPRKARRVDSNPYQIAIQMAARGEGAGNIQRRVRLPRCEVDLITRLHGRGTMAPWQTDPSMLEAIDAGF